MKEEEILKKYNRKFGKKVARDDSDIKDHTEQVAFLKKSMASIREDEREIVRD